MSNKLKGLLTAALMMSAMSESSYAIHGNLQRNPVDPEWKRKKCKSCKSMRSHSSFCGQGERTAPTHSACKKYQPNKK